MLGYTVIVDCAGSANTGTPQPIRVSVRDTGGGLSPHILPQLFQRFSRLGRERSAEESTGIGLVTGKRLVELMGGDVANA
jgi:signal transduction histidine kinase